MAERGHHFKNFVSLTFSELRANSSFLTSRRKEPPSLKIRCHLCNDLKKKDESRPRLALELTAEQCIRAIESKSCSICSLIVDGIRRFENASWSLRNDVSRVYLYALSSKGESLTAEVYFRTDRPKLVLEFYHTDGEIPEK